MMGANQSDEKKIQLMHTGAGAHIAHTHMNNYILNMGMAII